MSMISFGRVAGTLDGGAWMATGYHFINQSGERQGRTYSVWLQQDLFGTWTVVRVRGGRHRAGIVTVTPVESRQAGERLVAELVKLRLRHGYGVVGHVLDWLADDRA